MTTQAVTVLVPLDIQMKLSSEYTHMFGGDSDYSYSKWLVSRLIKNSDEADDIAETVVDHHDASKGATPALLFIFRSAADAERFSAALESEPGEPRLA